MPSIISTLGKIFRVKFQQTISNEFIFVEEISKEIFDQDEKCKYRHKCKCESNFSEIQSP